jgi:hypothetical protein
MKEPAANRTPVEIWRQILQDATFWELFPADHDPDLKRFSFFNHGCQRYHEFLEIAALRGTLRLVSRSWNAIIAEMVHDLVISDSKDKFWPTRDAVWRATCIEHFEESRYCQCGRSIARTRNNPFALPLPPTIQLTSNRRRDSDAHWTTEGTLQAKIVLTEFIERHPIRLLERTPYLQALSHSTLQERDDIFHWLMNNIHHRLTHLRLVDLTPTKLNDTGGSLELPSLKHLDLDLQLDENPNSPRKSLSKWKLPKLTILRISGYTTRQIKDEIEEQAFKCREHINIMVLGFAWENEDGDNVVWKADSPFWDSFTHLSFFGMSLEWFIEQEGDAPAPFPEIQRAVKMTVYIWDFFIDYDWTADSLIHCARNLLEWCGSFKSGIKEIVLGYTWKFVATVIKDQGKEGFAMGRFFFNEIVKGDIPFCDQNGVSLLDPEAEPFLTGLRKNKFPAGFTVH